MFAHEFPFTRLCSDMLLRGNEREAQPHQQYFLMQVEAESSESEMDICTKTLSISTLTPWFMVKSGFKLFFISFLFSLNPQR